MGEIVEDCPKSNDFYRAKTMINQLFEEMTNVRDELQISSCKFSSMTVTVQ